MIFHVSEIANIDQWGYEQHYVDMYLPRFHVH